MDVPKIDKVRLERESGTLKDMVLIFCNNRHNTDKNLCADCAELLEYALKRFEKCPYGEAKPACLKCETHCYKPEMRKKVRAVMKYSGPKMIWKHPVKALRHITGK
jgi:hypothetical protein